MKPSLTHAADRSALFRACSGRLIADLLNIEESIYSLKTLGCKLNELNCRVRNKSRGQSPKRFSIRRRGQSYSRSPRIPFSYCSWGDSPLPACLKSGRGRNSGLLSYSNLGSDLEPYVFEDSDDPVESEISDIMGHQSSQANVNGGLLENNGEGVSKGGKAGEVLHCLADRASSPPQSVLKLNSQGRARNSVSPHRLSDPLIAQAASKPATRHETKVHFIKGSRLSLFGRVQHCENELYHL